MKRKLVYALMTGVLSASMVFPSAVYADMESTDLTMVTSSSMKTSEKDKLYHTAGDETEDNIENKKAKAAQEVTPQVTLEVTPEATPQTTLEVTPEVTPEATPEVTPEATPEVTPEATPEVTPQITPEVTPEVTPDSDKESMLRDGGVWKKEANGKWWYPHADGGYTISDWEKIKGKWYHFDQDGWMETGWLCIKEKWYYFNPSGEMVLGRQQIDGKTYIFSEDGVMMHDWQDMGGIWYYCGASGAAETGWKVLGGRWYYFDETGIMQTSWTLIDGRWYYLGTSGSLETGWKQIAGKWYYFGMSGDMHTGWELLGGNWYFFKSSGEMTTGLYSVEGKTYIFDENGYMQFGWQKADGKWYYILNNGSACTGWNMVRGSWYYFYADGIMATGMIKEEGKQYYLGESGAMASGWIKYKDNWYYAEASGALADGWKHINGADYYFYASGKMAAKEWVGDYYVNADGAYVPSRLPAANRGWHQFGNRWGFVDNDGNWITGRQIEIKGKDYYFDQEGWMVAGWLDRGSYWNYFHEDGSKAYDEWIGTKGIGGYYINKYGKMVANDTYSLGNTLYTFDKNGKCIDATQRYIYVTDKNGRRYKVEHQYATDPHVGDVINGHKITEDEYLSAAVFSEAGILKKTGMTAVALVMLNRMYDSDKAYPSQADIMLYDAMQFEVARNGAMKEWLYNIESPTLDGAKEAVREARRIMNDYLEKKTPRTVEGIAMPEGKKDFDYWGFMTIDAFNNIGLDYEKTEACTYKNTVFYTRWIKK